MEIYSFGLGIPSKFDNPILLGGKGAGLVWMDQQGVPVPPGFIIPTTECVHYMKSPTKVMAEVEAEIGTWLKRLEAKFGYAPLLSVRSGARKSMPGMMDTILNVGLDEAVAKDWIARVGAECVGDSRRRLVEMYGSVVKGIERKKFEGLDAAGARDLYSAETGEAFPPAAVQLVNSIEAVFKSWNNERAKTYRQMYGIPDEWGTAVTVQAMVFGNMNEQSATGVLFTRNPDSGAPGVMGDWLVKAQGEDVVDGSHTPRKLEEMGDWNLDAYTSLIHTVLKLETQKKDVQDVEFTVQDGKLYILQTRNAKRSSRAAVRIAVDMVSEGLITPEEAFKMVTLKDYLRAQAPVLDPTFDALPAYTGIVACSGVVVGKVVHSSADAVAHSKEGVILVTHETTPDDIAGMAAARGVLTLNGGATSHAAVVARGMNKPTIVGLAWKIVDGVMVPSGAEMKHFPEGQIVTMDGATGRVWYGEAPTVDGSKDPYVAKLGALMEEHAKLDGYIGQTEGDVLDVSELTPEAAKRVVHKAVYMTTKPYVVVDTRCPDAEPHKTFGTMFPAGPVGIAAESALLKELGKLPAKERKKIRVVSSIHVETLSLAEPGTYGTCQSKVQMAALLLT